MTTSPATHLAAWTNIRAATTSAKMQRNLISPPPFVILVFQDIEQLFLQTLCRLCRLIKLLSYILHVAFKNP